MKKATYTFRNNGETFKFDLCTHAAWMLLDGIRIYLRLIKRLYRNKIEQADYCFMMACTAHDEAVRLKKWAVKNKMQNINISNLDYLIEEIIKMREKFRRISEKKIWKGAFSKKR